MPPSLGEPAYLIVVDGFSIVHSLLEDVLVVPKHSIVKQVNEHYLPKLFVHTTKEADAVAEADSAQANMYFNQASIIPCSLNDGNSLSIGWVWGSVLYVSS